MPQRHTTSYNTFLPRGSYNESDEEDDVNLDAEFEDEFRIDDETLRHFYEEQNMDTNANVDELIPDTTPSNNDEVNLMNNGQ